MAAEAIVLCKRKDAGSSKRIRCNSKAQFQTSVNDRYRAIAEAILFYEVTDNGGLPKGMKGTVVHVLPHCGMLKIG